MTLRILQHTVATCDMLQDSTVLYIQWPRFVTHNYTYLYTQSSFLLTFVILIFFIHNLHTTTGHDIINSTFLYSFTRILYYKHCGVTTIVSYIGSHTTNTTALCSLPCVKIFCNVGLMVLFSDYNM